MSKTADKIIPRLNQMSESLESLSLNDREAWSKLAQDTDQLKAEVPKRMTPLRDLLSACSVGVAAIADKSLSDYLAAIDAIADGFAAAARYLQNAPDRDVLTHTAGERILAQMPTATTGQTASSAQEHAPAPQLENLDDLAAFLIQSEPGQEQALRQLHAALHKLIRKAEYPADVNILLQQTLDGLDPEAPPADWRDTLGAALEKAMDLQHESHKQPPEKPQSKPSPARAQTPPEAADASVAPEAPREKGGARPDTKDYMPEDPDFELIAEFVEEGSDLIAKAEEALLKLEVDPADMEAVGMVFRAFHTVKGTSAFLELAIIADMGHHAESLLSRVRDHEIRYSGGYADISLRALDMLKELVRRVQEALTGGALHKPEGYDELLRVLSDPEAAGISEESQDQAAPRLGDLLVAQGKVSREAVEEAIAAPRVGDILVAQGKATRETVEEAAHLGGDEPLGTKLVHSQKASARDVGQALRTQKRMVAPQNVVDTSVRVSTNRLDRLIDMVGELVIAHSMVAQDNVVLNGHNYDLIKKIGHTSKIVRELQDMSMSLRMVPLKATFNKMTRLVRDVARKLGKQVNLVTEGEETEIDRNLVDIINDPLVHMIRNAVDHGIEMPEARTAAGKPETGEIKLSAYHSAGNVIVEIQDNGKGLDREVLVQKAIANGLITDGANLSDREVFNLIFEPGFSTAAEVTDVSGRGVGMDVVRKNIESLRGQVEISSVKGVGSTFKMSLPLTLAIIDGMVVGVSHETYVIPTVSIVKSINPERRKIATVYGRGEMISVQGKLIPLVRLDELYDLDPETEAGDNLLVVIVEDEHHQAGLVIRELVGRQQVVIKSLGETMRNIPGIAGSAIMPNGRVGLILDVGGLLRYANKESAESHGDKRQSDGALAAA